MSEKEAQISPKDSIEQSQEQTNNELREMISKIQRDHEEERLTHQLDISELKQQISEYSTPSSTSDQLTTPPDRRQTTRRTSIFFSAPSASEFYVAPGSVRTSVPKPPLLGSPSLNPYVNPTVPPVIQVLQADITYDNQLKVTSLEGLTYLSKQLQLLLSRHPGRQIKIAHMVSIPLRQNIVSSWNSHLTKKAISSGIESPEYMVNDWLTFDNDLVQEMLLEAARPRTRDQYSQELVRFLLKAIPQSPDINVENFNKIYFDPLMKSLQDLLHLHDLLSADTSNHSNNASRMPPTSYGTRETPGHIQLWIISLGSQKDAILNWLGKDELQKYKTLAPAIKYVRNKLMTARSESESRQDFQHQLTPIKYEDIRKTQGEFTQRQQVNFTPRQQYSAQSSQRSHGSHHRSSLAALSAPDNADDSYDDFYDDGDNDSYDDFFSPVPNLHKDNHHFLPDNMNTVDPLGMTPHENESIPFGVDDIHNSYDSGASYCAINSIHASSTSRNAISAAFRGYCSEAFVYGKCSRRDSGCQMDHSTAAQERCILSFALLTKRELSQHSDLPPWNLSSSHSPKPNASVPYSDARSLRPQPSTFTQPRTYGSNASHTGPPRTTPSTARPFLK